MILPAGRELQPHTSNHSFVVNIYVVRTARVNNIFLRISNGSVGKHDLRRQGERYERTHRVSHVISHPSFSFRHFQNDVALIRVSQPILFNNGIQPICLPKQQPRVGDKCYITGILYLYCTQLIQLRLVFMRTNNNNSFVAIDTISTIFIEIVQ